MISINPRILTPVAPVAAVLALCVAPASGAVERPRAAVEHSGSVTVEVSPVQTVTVDLPAQACANTGSGPEWCSPSSLRVGGWGSKGKVTVEWHVSSGDDPKVSSRACGSGGNRIHLRKSAGNLRLRIRATRGRTQIDTGWQSYRGRDAEVTVSAC